MKNSEETIRQLMNERSISRKSAVQFLRRQNKRHGSIAASNAAFAEQYVTSVNTDQTFVTGAPPITILAEVAPSTESAPVDKTETILSDTGKAPDVFSQPRVWNPSRAVELYKAGMKIIDIAVEMGYARGQGCNRTKAALAKAGAL